jgi:23S rRNA pseudouridine1911/1915/1917 synthase
VGLPVAGDPRYGTGGGPAPRLFLHASDLAFDHPVDGHHVEVASPLPDDLQAALDALGPPAIGTVR